MPFTFYLKIIQANRRAYKRNWLDISVVSKLICLASCPGSAEVNQDQAMAIAEFFELDKLEKEFFFNLVNQNRAATKSLRNYYQEKLDSIVAKKMEISSRVLSDNTLDAEKKSIYYSDWVFCAIHIITAIEQYQTVAAISEFFHLPQVRVIEVLEFLESCGLIIKKNHRYTQTHYNLHLEQRSPFIRSHHINWRQKSIQTLSQRNSQNLNYSSVISCGASDTVQIKEIMLTAIKKIREVVKSSPDENIYCYSLDFFELQ